MISWRYREHKIVYEYSPIHTCSQWKNIQHCKVFLRKDPFTKVVVAVGLTSLPNPGLSGWHLPYLELWIFLCLGVLWLAGVVWATSPTHQTSLSQQASSIPITCVLDKSCHWNHHTHHINIHTIYMHENDQEYIYIYSVQVWYCNIPISIGQRLATWLEARAFSQMVSMSASVRR